MINDVDIFLIEHGMGFKLYEYQKDYLKDKGLLEGDRGTGKTVAYCIKLALSEGEPLNVKKPETFSDEKYLENHLSYSRGFFIKEFLRIREILGSYGFTVRDIKS